MRDTAGYESNCAESAEPSLLDGLTEEQRQRLVNVLDGYLRSLEGGLPPRGEQLVERNPDLAEPLGAYLRNLLELHDVAVAFGRDAPEAPVSSGVDDEKKRLGDFVLLRELGRGGMGVVYEAEQISLSRRVALKVLPFAAVLDSQQIARFKNEAQAAAQLHHPNIVPVYAVGSESGVHYYAMQFVDGQPLDRAIAELRAAAEANPPPTEAHGSGAPVDAAAETIAWPTGESFLTGRWTNRQEYFRSVARLGIQAAEALHAAHGYGVVHRDVKPSNLLLESNGKLWVADFGLARCQSGIALTRTGDVVGTRQYMSPEQAVGQAALVDQRTDVYSLGATLYELLTLRPAFDADDGTTLSRRIDQQEPVRLRSLQPLLPVDLETVVQKAMAPGRDERYQTAQELADDLRRVLEGKPTVAQPPTLVERLGKLARRHRRVVAAAGAIGLLAIVGLATATLLINREKVKAQHDYARAEQYFRQAEDTVDLLGSRFAERLIDVPGAESVRRELLEETLRYYRQFIEQAGDDPALRSDLAMTYGKIGTLKDRMGLTEEAMGAHESAIELLKKLADEQSDAREFRRHLAVCQNNLALTLGRAGRGDDARDAFHSAIQLQRELIAEHGENVELRFELALSHNNLGSLQRETGRTDEARRSFHEAIRLNEDFEEHAADDARRLRNMAAAYNNLAAIDAGADQASSITLHRKAADHQRSAVKARPADLKYQSDLAATRANLGAAQSRGGQLKQAVATYRDAIKLQKKLVRIVPLKRAFRRDLAVSYNNLGLAYTRLGQSDFAERCFNNALGFQEQLLAERPDDFDMQSSLGGIHNNLGIVRESQSRWQDAAESFARAVEHQQIAFSRAAGVDRYRTFLSKHYYNHGRVLRRLGELDEAVRVAAARKELWPHDADRLLSVAEELAVAAKLARDDQAAARSAKRYTHLAISTLREATSAGLRVPADLDRRDSFSAIKGHPDFVELAK